MVAIAIPDSCLGDEGTQVDKSRKISQIARACAIFGVETIFVYEDGGPRRDRILLLEILRYMETPPFLRRRLFPKSQELKFAGVLSPLKIKSHVTPPNPRKIAAGNLRDGVVVPHKGKKYLDIGTADALPYRGRAEPGARVTVRFKTGYPELECSELGHDEPRPGGGYCVRPRKSLSGIMSSWTGRIILTSRKGQTATAADVAKYGRQPGVLLAFGSTDRGVHDILGSSIKKAQNARILNFFPEQQTETVRLEEAVLGCLAVLYRGA